MPPAVRKCQTFTTHHPPYQICTLEQTHTKRKGIQYTCTWYAQKRTHAHTLLTHNTTEEISLVRGCMALIFASLWSWWDLVWHSLAHAREPTTTPRVKPITFLGSRETWGVKGSSFVPLLPLHSPPPLFSPPFFPSADLFICSWGLATMGLWLHSLTWAGNDFKFSGLHLWILNTETNEEKKEVRLERKNGTMAD